MSAAHLCLDNLTVVVDCNTLQQDGPTDDVLSVDIEALAKACKWNVLVVDGHNHKELKDAFAMKFENEMPKCIVVNTIKGKGVSFMENDNSWHHANMNEKQYNQAVEELSHD